MKVLRVGDPHIKPNNIQESEALMAFVIDRALHNKVDRLEILGDLFDSHDIVRLSVLEFWDKWFNILSKQTFKTVILVGNHDLTGNYNNCYSALRPFLSLENSNFKIVHEPYLDGVYGYLPYIHSNEEFVKQANLLADQGAKVLVSHPNYEGAVYDNGSPIHGAVDPNSLDSRFLHLIGGHIHTEIEIGRVWYTGNPRWLTKSCANKDKGIWLCCHNDATGAIDNLEDKIFISTQSVCIPMISLVWKEGQPKPEIPLNAKVDIELHGSSDWVSQQKLGLKNISISSKLTDVKKGAIRKSGKSLHEFLLKHYQTDKREKLLKYMEGLNLV